MVSDSLQAAAGGGAVSPNSDVVIDTGNKSYKRASLGNDSPYVSQYPMTAVQIHIFVKLLNAPQSCVLMCHLVAIKVTLGGTIEGNLLLTFWHFSYYPLFVILYFENKRRCRVSRKKKKKAKIKRH